jgi:hypothetical protein
MISNASGTDAFEISVNLIVNEKRYTLTLDPVKPVKPAPSTKPGWAER